MLLLVRHGETTANAAQLLVGRADAPLTDKGRAQAAAIGSVLGPVRRVVTSPLLRARDTAALLGVDAPIEIDERWVELDYGEYDLRPLSTVPAEVWRRWREDPAYAPEGGESLADLRRRVASAFFALAEEAGAESDAGAGHVVVVSHVSPIKAAVACTLDADDPVVWRLHLATGSLTRVGWAHGVPVLHSFNETAPPVLP